MIACKQFYQNGISRPGGHSRTNKFLSKSHASLAAPKPSAQKIERVSRQYILVVQAVQQYARSSGQQTACRAAQRSALPRQRPGNKGQLTGEAGAPFAGHPRRNKTQTQGRASRAVKGCTSGTNKSKQGGLECQVGVGDGGVVSRWLACMDLSRALQGIMRR